MYIVRLISIAKTKAGGGGRTVSHVYCNLIEIYIYIYETIKWNFIFFSPLVIHGWLGPYGKIIETQVICTRDCKGSVILPQGYGGMASNSSIIIIIITHQIFLSLISICFRCCLSFCSILPFDAKLHVMESTLLIALIDGLCFKIYKVEDASIMPHSAVHFLI